MKCIHITIVLAFYTLGFGSPFDLDVDGVVADMMSTF
jgi:hypothetical protein